MTIDELRQQLVAGHHEVAAILEQLHKPSAGHVLLTGLHASILAVVWSAVR